MCRPKSHNNQHLVTDKTLMLMMRKSASVGFLHSLHQDFMNWMRSASSDWVMMIQVPWWRGVFFDNANQGGPNHARSGSISAISSTVHFVDLDLVQEALHNPCPVSSIVVLKRPNMLQ